jgi:hypothetical protein
MTIIVTERDPNCFDAILGINTSIFFDDTNVKHINIQKLVIKLAMVDLPNVKKNSILDGIEASVLYIQPVGVVPNTDISNDYYVFNDYSYEIDHEITRMAEDTYKLIGNTELSIEDKNSIARLVETILFSDESDMDIFIFGSLNE